jgi:DNA-binding transcriptional LysR family regulator
VELADLQFVAASADAGNFVAAAKSLGLYPSTVSRRVSRFEDELGLTLFERGQFGVRLTTGGRAVMVHIRRALGDIEAVKRSGESNARGDVGEIRLGPLIQPFGTCLANGGRLIR